MFCRYNPTFHVVTALTPTPSETPTSLVMTVTNDGNISSLDPFYLVLAKNPYAVISGDPVPYQITINGTAVALLNKYALPIYSNRLSMRRPRPYVGSYVVPEEGDPYVILWDTPDNPAFATATVSSATATTGTGTGATSSGKTSTATTKA